MYSATGLLGAVWPRAGIYNHGTGVMDSGLAAPLTLRDAPE